MELCRIEGTNRMKINFKIPMKSPTKTNENLANIQNTEKYTSPLISEPEPERESKPENNNTENKILVNTISTTNYEPIKTKPLKRKLISETRLYAGRNIQYPDELNNLILPLFCKVCSAALNSAKSAHFHYLSKSHEKKINNWLGEWAKRTGEPLPKIQKDEKTLSKNSGVLYCEYCDVNLTSLQDAQQHYSGKKHASKVNFGMLSAQKNNIENSTKKNNITLNDNRFGIGEEFNPPPKSSESVSVPESSEIKQNTYCDLCKIHTTSEQQLTKHIQGLKHFKKYKELYPEKTFAERDFQLSKEILNCRTPSGQFYCKTCNITVPDDKIFSQHLISRRHGKNFKKVNQLEKTKKLDT